jgi:hypothetical protein
MSHYRIKNWESFQHYKDRSPPWIKLHRTMLTSRTWVTASDSERVLAIACMLVAADTDNEIPADAEYMKRVAYLNKDPDFAALVKRDFIEFVDENGSVLATASASQAKATKRNTEAEAEQSREETDKTPIPPKGAAADSNLHEQIIATYHEVLPDLPAVRDWPERRRKKLEARIGERLKAGKQADQVSYWRALFTNVQASDFLCGRKSDWRCPGLEWLLEPKNFTKVIEGAYRNNESMNGASHAR